MSHPSLEAEEYKARYMMLASGEPTERLERVAKAAKSLADSALEMARTTPYPLRECINLIHEALDVSLKATGPAQSQFIIKGGDGGTLPGERGGDVHVTLVSPLDATEELKRKIREHHDMNEHERT